MGLGSKLRRDHNWRFMERKRERSPHQCLKKAGDLHATITSHWVAQPWYPVALTMSIDYPWCLPHLEILLEATANADPPSMPIQPKLVAWLISGNPSLIKEFQKKLRTCCPLPGSQSIYTLAGGKEPIKNYDSAWRKWEQWSIGNHAPISASLNNTLACLLKSSISCRTWLSFTLNVYWSALSSIHEGWAWPASKYCNRGCSITFSSLNLHYHPYFAEHFFYL